MQVTERDVVHLGTTSVVPTGTDAGETGVVNLAQEPGSTTKSTMPSATRKKEPKKTSTSTSSTTSASPTSPARSPQLPKATTSPKVVVPSGPSPKLQRYNSNPDLPSDDITPESPTPTQQRQTPRSPRKHKKVRETPEKDDKGKEKEVTKDEVENLSSPATTSLPPSLKSPSSPREEIPRLRLLQKRHRKSKTPQMEGISAITADEEAVLSQIEENLSYGIYDSDSASKSPDVDVDIDVAFKHQNTPDKKRHSIEVSATHSNSSLSFVASSPSLPSLVVHSH